MSPQFDLSSVHAGQTCAKCDRLGRIERHHKGCERMWLRHFIRKKASKRYKEFKARYDEFHPHDCVPLCHDCHEAIHQVYILIIRSEVRASGTHCSLWSWNEAHNLMVKLRKNCDLWLAVRPNG